MFTRANPKSGVIGEDASMKGTPGEENALKMSTESNEEWFKSKIKEKGRKGVTLMDTTM